MAEIRERAGPRQTQKLHALVYTMNMHSGALVFGNYIGQLSSVLGALQGRLKGLNR